MPLPGSAAREARTARSSQAASKAGTTPAAREPRWVNPTTWRVHVGWGLDRCGRVGCGSPRGDRSLRNPQPRARLRQQSLAAHVHGERGAAAAGCRRRSRPRPRGHSLLDPRPQEREGALLEEQAHHLAGAGSRREAGGKCGELQRTAVAGKNTGLRFCTWTSLRRRRVIVSGPSAMKRPLRETRLASCGGGSRGRERPGGFDDAQSPPTCAGVAAGVLGKRRAGRMSAHL